METIANYSHRLAVRLLLMVCFVVLGNAVQASAKSAKEIRKEAKKLRKDGWDVSGSKMLSLEEVLERYYQKLESSGSRGIALMGYGKARVLNVAVRMADNDAKVKLAAMLDTHVDGSTEMDFTNVEANGEIDENTKVVVTDHTSTAYKVKNFVPSMTLSRRLDNGYYEVHAFYVYVTQ